MDRVYVRQTPLLSCLLLAGLAAAAAMTWVVAAAWVDRRGAPTAVTRALAGEEAANELRADLEVLRRQVAARAVEQAARGGAPPVLSAREAADRASAALAAADPAHAAARDRRRFAALAGKLEAEAVDPAWAPATERLVAETLTKPVFAGSTLLGATCRSTLCRLEVQHESEDHRRRFARTLPTRLPALPSGSMRNGEGEALTSIVYVAREGHRIPRDDGEDETPVAIPDREETRP